jgi:hypothetical protein
VRALIFTLAFLAVSQLKAATATTQLSSYCYGVSINPAEAFAAPFDEIVLSAARPHDTCGYQFDTSTPDVISLESVTFTESTIEIRVQSLRPGEGALTVTNRLPGNGGLHTHTVSKIHVDSCAEGAHQIKLAPSYSMTPGTTLHLEPQVIGLFQGSYWSVNDMPKIVGPLFDFTPPGLGRFTVTLHVDTYCGLLESSTLVTVAPQRARAVRRR